jgi:hypothetical protein
VATRQHHFGASAVTANNGPVYANLFYTSNSLGWNSSDTRYRIPAAGTISNLKVNLQSGGPGGTDTATFTIYKNGVATALTLTISGSTSQGSSTASVGVAVDDEISLVLTRTSAFSPANIRPLWSFTYSSSEGDGIAIYPAGTLLQSGAVTNVPVISGGTTHGLISTGGNLTKARYHLSVAPGSGKSYTFTLLKDDVAQDGSGGTPDTRVTISDAATSGTWSGTLAATAGQTIRLECTPAGTPTAATVQASTCFVATTDGEFNICGGSNDFLVGSPIYYALMGSDAGLSATESERVHYLGINGLTIKNLYVKCINGTLTNATATVRKNSADTALACTVVAGSTGNDTTDSIAFTSGSTIAIQWTGAYGLNRAAITGVTGIDNVSGPLQRITQLVMLYGYNRYSDEDPPPTAGLCAGGGTVAVGANPTDGAGISTSTQLHAWIETGDIGGAIYRWAKVGIPHGNPKTPRVLSFGDLTRALSDDKGGFEGSSMTIQLSDYDRVLRGLHATQTLLNKSIAVYVADAATIAANGSPWKVFRGVVRDFEPESDLKFRITIEDPLTLTMSAFAQEKLVPPTLISISDGTADQGLRESPVPVLYGALSDEDDDDPIGTIEAPFIGTETPAGHQELGNLHKHLIGLSACGSVKSVFLADPDSGDPPTARAKAPESEYGSRIYVPHQTGWFGDELYSVEEGERWTFLYLDQNHPAADLARYNRIPIAVNVCGREDIGDATGNTLDSLPLQFLHFLNTEVAQEVGDADWPGIAQRDSYSLFDTTTFTTTKQRSESRTSGGYKGAFVLGHSYKQITLREALKQFCRSGDFSVGINRHGQIIVSMLDITATTGTVTFTDQSDILKDSFRINPRLDNVENRVRYAYKRNYLKTIQQPNPEIGSRLPREPFDKDWLSGTQTLNDTTEQTNLGEVRSSQLLELEMVRDQSTADDVAARRLALRKPSNGRAEATFSSTLSKGYSVELGDLVNVTHFQGIGSTGWTNKRCRVLRIVDDLDNFTRTFTVQDIDNLLAQAPASDAIQWDGDDVTWDAEVVTE